MLASDFKSVIIMQFECHQCQIVTQKLDFETTTKNQNEKKKFNITQGMGSTKHVEDGMISKNIMLVLVDSAYLF